MSDYAEIAERSRPVFSGAVYLLLALLALAAWFVNPLIALVLMLVAVVGAAAEWRFSGTTLIAAFAVVLLIVPADAHLAAGLPAAVTASRTFLALLLLAWAGGVLDADKDRRAELLPGDPGIVLKWLLFIALVSLLVNSGRTMAENVFATDTKGLLMLAAYVASFFLVRAVVRSRDEVLLIVKVLVVVGTIGAVVGIVERFTQVNLVRTVTSSLPLLELNPPPEAGEMMRGGAVRVYGTAEHPIAFGGVLSLLLPLGLSLSLNSRRFTRLAWLAATGLMSIAMLFTVSRSAVIATAVGFLLLLVFWPRHRSTLLVSAAFGVFAVHMVIPGLLGTFKALFQPDTMIAQQNNPEFSGRIIAFTKAKPMLASFPLLGRGFNDFDPHRYFYLDNQSLKTMLELGLAGSIAVALFLFRVVLLTLRHLGDWGEDAPVQAALVASAVSFGVLSFLFDTAAFVQVTFVFLIVSALAVRLAELAVLQDEEGLR